MSLPPPVEVSGHDYLEVIFFTRVFPGLEPGLEQVLEWASRSCILLNYEHKKEQEREGERRSSHGNK